MKTFKDSDLKTFEQLVKLPQPSLKRVVANFLKKHYPRVIETADYVFAEGEIPIALVAHMDTVFKFPPEEVFFDQRHNVMWSPDGLGADDRAGVFAILQIIRSGLRPHVVFTTEEEAGGVGASKLIAIDCPFRDLRYVIELDRRGSNDCVFYDCDNPEFTEYIESFGFSWNFGSFTDISILCPEWGVAGVNLSVGYRDEHSTSEVLFVGQLLSTIEKVKVMLQEEDIPKFEYIESKLNYYDYWIRDISKGDKYAAYGWSDVVKCHCCGRTFMEEEMYPVVMLDGSTSFYCTDCLVNVAWCDECNSAYQKHSPEAPDTGLCVLCKELKEKQKDGNNNKGNKTEG